jgi:hypothetical protein
LSPAASSRHHDRVNGSRPTASIIAGREAMTPKLEWRIVFLSRVRGSISTRFRYNPDVKSLPAILPTTIAILLLLIPAMLSTLSVVREKELGSSSTSMSLPPRDSCSASSFRMSCWGHSIFCC